jgi:hypothetical protein
MKTILKLVMKNKKADFIQEKLDKGYEKISLFQPLPELKNKSLFIHLKDYGKLKGWTLNDFIKIGTVDLHEENEEGYTLAQLFIINDDLPNLIRLLKHEIMLSIEDCLLAKENDATRIINFLNYRPGKDEVSIFEFCSSPRDENYLSNLDAIIYDEADTTDEESSEAEDNEYFELSLKEQCRVNDLRNKELKNFNKKQEDNDSLCLVAARGVHFSPKYFSKEAVENIKETRNERHTTFSQSTLFDAGYSADDEVNETDKKIRKRHNRNLNFIQKLKESPDKKEKKIGKIKPAASRNNIEFESHYYRYMQVYINSYGRLFNQGAIVSDFGFVSTNNPEVSASWNFVKGAMYGSGVRINWNNPQLRKNPHYRRFTGKPKHPNVGYLDIFVFDIDYARTHGFDRQIMCQEGLIYLSAFYRHEAEIIFHSMIPAKFHERRYILSMPSLDKDYSSDFSEYGINSCSAYNKLRETIRTFPKNKASEAYKEKINKITEKAATAQATFIEKTIQYRLFKSKKPKVMVYDHGTELSSTIFTL